MNQTPQASDESTNVETPTTDPGTVKPQEQTVDYETKFKESAKGAQELLQQKKQLEAEKQRLEEELERTRTRTPEPAQPAPQVNLQQPVQGMDEETLRLLKIAADGTKFELEFSEAVSKYPKLAQHKEAFKMFAYQSENIQTPTALLASDYVIANRLFDEVEEEEPVAEEPALEPGVGGGRTAPPKDGYSQEEAQHLRKTDPKQYNRLVQSGKMIIK